MTFNSIEFAVFLPIVLVLYWQLKRRNQNVLLLVASYIFYGWWDPRFLLLIVLSTVIDYTVARGLDASDDARRRKRLVTLSIAANLGILGAFKYFNFFAESLEDVLEALGSGWAAPSVSIVLPVGISFYTFQTMSYTIDVYRRTIPAERSLLDVAVYVAYFPQLVAGPIERAHRLMPQVTSPRDRPRPDQIKSGLLLILIGLVKKVVVADALAPIVNETFDEASTASSLSLLFAVYAFAFQIYADFSGYSSIARGTSRLLGIELIENFKQPYLSHNISVFWRTWHISLSSWLRDYLYIPLGGNRRGIRRIYVNLFITMLLGGLWHGASWNFVVWGGLHGVYLAVHRRWRARTEYTDTSIPTLRDIPGIIATFHLVCFSWIFFRAETFGQAWVVIRGLGELTTEVELASILMISTLAAFTTMLDLSQRRSGTHTPMLRYPAMARGGLYGLMAVLILAFSGGETVEFIYFQF